MRRRRLLFSLLLVAAAGLGTAAVPPQGATGATARAATPLDRVIPAPASVHGGGAAVTLGAHTPSASRAAPARPGGSPAISPGCCGPPPASPSR